MPKTDKLQIPPHRQMTEMNAHVFFYHSQNALLALSTAFYYGEKLCGKSQKMLSTILEEQSILQSPNRQREEKTTHSIRALTLCVDRRKRKIAVCCCCGTIYLIDLLFNNSSFFFATNFRSTYMQMYPPFFV